MSDVKDDTADVPTRFMHACATDDVFILKELIDLPEIEIHTINEAFKHACSWGSLSVVQYLTSPETPKNPDMRECQETAFNHFNWQKNYEALQYLIFVLKIEKTELIDKYLRAGQNQQVENMFTLRGLNERLNSELSADRPFGKKMKV